MLLKELSEAMGPSGNEGAVRDLILAAVESDIDSHRVDALGNLICYKEACGASGDGTPLKVMVAAHMDEIGFVITNYNDDGTLRFDQVGGIDDRILLSKQVVIGSKAIPGVIGYRPIHLISREERKKPADVKNAAIDIGASNKDEAKEQVNIGDFAVFRTAYEALHQDKLRSVKGKAFDDRAGCAVLIELLKAEYPFDLYAAFTAQEEVGLRGARVAAHSIDPDAALVLEGTICDDLPKKKDESPVTELGKGPAITFMDRTLIADRRLLKLLTDTAERENIPYQFKRTVAGGTDSGAIHLAREGVPSITVSVPCRYIHAPAAILSLSDLEATVRLAQAALPNLEGVL